MKETVVSKRPREDVEEEEVDSEEYSKRHKPFNHILSLLESEEDEPTEDLSSLITTLQQEITNSASHSDTLLSQAQENAQHNLTATSEDHSDSASSSSSFKDQILKVDEEEEEDKRRVMRHLLEASDDELGIPNTGNCGLMGFGDDIGFHGGENHGVPFSDGLWELEDETANYYALLQSQLFM